MTPSMSVGTVRRDRPADILSLNLSGMRICVESGYLAEFPDGVKTFCVRGGPRRARRTAFVSAEDAEGAENFNTFWIREEARRTAKTSGKSVA